MLQMLEGTKNFYLVMEYVESGTLTDAFIREDDFGEEHACHTIKQVLEGIAYLHNAGICHRDLKPDNVLVDGVTAEGFPDIKISDAGYATFFREEADTLNCSLGTRLYLAPELIKKDKHDEKVDIWSTGVIAFFLLNFGEYPFPGETIEEVDENIRDTEPDYDDLDHLSPLAVEFI